MASSPSERTVEPVPLTQPVAGLQEHHPQVGLDRRRRTAHLSREQLPVGSKNTGSSRRASTRANSAGKSSKPIGEVDSGVDYIATLLDGGKSMSQ